MPRPGAPAAPGPFLLAQVTNRPAAIPDVSAAYCPHAVGSSGDAIVIPRPIPRYQNSIARSHGAELLRRLGCGPRGERCAVANAACGRGPHAAGADRANQQRRIRPGLRQRLAHRSDAEGVAADAVARDRADAPNRRSPSTRASSRAAAGRQVPPVDRLRLGNRHPSVVRVAPAARSSAAISTPHAGVSPTSSIPMSKPAVRRFQARHGLTVDGIVREADLRRAQHSRRDVRARPAQDQCRAAAQTLTGNLGALRDVQHSGGADRGDRERRRGVAPHRAWSASPTGRRPKSTARSSRSISIRTGPCRSRSCARDLIPKMQDEPDYLTKNHIRIFDSDGNELQPSQINWYSEEAINYTFKQDPGDFNSLGSIRINFPNAHGVYMHDTPLQESVRRGFPLPFVGLRARAERARTGRLAAARNARLVARRDRRVDPIRRAQGCAAGQAGAAPLGLCHRLGDADGVVQFRDDIYGRDGLAAGIPPTTASRADAVRPRRSLDIAAV